MFKSISISIYIQILVHTYVIKEILENTSVSPKNWMLDNNTPYTSTTLCAESKVGPYWGSLTPMSKDRSLILDIYYTEHWGTPGNYFEIILDGTQIFSDSNIMTPTLSSPSAQYCSNNDILGLPRNKKVITIQSKILHQNINYLLEVKGSFYCVQLLPLQYYCERAGIKNLYLYIEECHESCLTCSGPLKTNCLTCPSGVVTAGQCSCGGLFVSKNQCVASCSANEEVMSGYCVESCRTDCSVCLNQICSSCQIGFQLYQGKCTSSCPTYSIINGTNCDDLTTISNFGSEYLGKYFYTLENNIATDLAPFTFTSSSGNSFLTGQKYCIYRNFFILGGLGVWADGIFKISFSSLSPHNMVRIQMKLYFIDSWNGEEFVIRVDGVQVYSKTVVSPTQSLNLLFRDAKDRIEPVTLSLPHLTSTLMIEFESKLTQSAFIASAGITDLFVLIDYCDISCALCGATQCTLCLSPYTLISNKCIICGSDNKRNSNCSCMDGYFDDTQISCQQCPIQCQGCLSFNQCTNCTQENQFNNQIQEYLFLLIQLQFGAISNQTDQYKYSQTIITTNPYFQDPDFKQLTDGTPNMLYLPNLTQIRNNEPITQLNKKIDYIFDITKQQLQDNKVFECASKISDMWSVDVCKNIENSENQRICQCSEISAITLIDAALELTDNFFLSSVYIHCLEQNNMILPVIFLHTLQLQKPSFILSYLFGVISQINNRMTCKALLKYSLLLIRILNQLLIQVNQQRMKKYLKINVMGGDQFILLQNTLLKIKFLKISRFLEGRIFAIRLYINFIQSLPY